MTTYFKKLTAALICTFLFIPTANAAPDIRSIGFCIGMLSYLNMNNVPITNTLTPETINKLNKLGIFKLSIDVNNYREEYFNCVTKKNRSAQECTSNIKDSNQKLFLIHSANGAAKAQRDGVDQTKLNAALVCMEGALGI